MTRKPTGDGDGYVTATYGTRNRLGLRAGADFKLAEHRFARLAGTFADQTAMSTCTATAASFRAAA